MSWQLLKFTSTQAQIESLTGFLEETGALSITLQDNTDQPVYEPPPGTIETWPETRITALYDDDIEISQIISFLAKRLGKQPLPCWEIETIEDQDWERAWMQDFKPMRFGQYLWVCPSTHTPPDPSAVNILLDPGLAFGTGTHPTTALCLEQLDKKPPVGLDVIDYGCGSGILAIAAAKLGARAIWAIDIDKQALEACHNNRIRNNLPDTIKMLSPEQLPDIQVDLLIANILVLPLIELADKFYDLVKPGGRLILSGILDNQIDMISAAYSDLFECSGLFQKDEWLCWTGTK